MTLYQRLPERIDATRVLDAAQAAQLLGGVGSLEGTTWTVTVASVDAEGGPVTLTWTGEVGDYLLDGRVVPAADFEAHWTLGAL